LPRPEATSAATFRPWTRNESKLGVPAPLEADPKWNGEQLARVPFGSADPGVLAPQVRLYSVTTIIVPPVFVGFFTLIAVSAIPNDSGRPIGIGAAVLAVLFALIFSRRPYVATVRQDGSLTFKALIASKETAISRVSRIGLSTGARGVSSWIFQFDGTSAKLGDIGGSALAHYVIERNPAVEHPVGRFSL
jgi:hypothetical protein